MCGESFRLHYIEKIRPKTTTSALIFGAALDQALNKILLNEPDSAEDTFEHFFKRQEINGVETDLQTSENVLYAKADYDVDLLSANDVETLKEEATRSGLSGYTDHLSAFKEIRKKREESTLSLEETRYYNLSNWLCLRQKGLLMLEAYKTKVFPRLLKVHEIQKEIKLENENGDIVVGFVDLIADVEGEGTVVLDNKTAGRPYAPDSVKTSEQLSLYLHAVEQQYKTRKAGYIVLLKNVAKNKKKICQLCGDDGSSTSHTTCSVITDGKRCKGSFAITIRPEINVQFIVDEISERKEAEIIAAADLANDQINSGIFEKNENQCHNWYGQRCPYFNLCHGNSMNNLIKKEDKDGGK